MPTSLARCAMLLNQDGVRHHLDREDAALLAVFVTKRYENPRGEHLAVVRIETPDDGRRCRASIARAFPAAADPAAACLAACRLAAETPLVGVEFAADAVRLVVETVVEDGRLTRLQLLTMVDALVAAAEAWHASLPTRGCVYRRASRRGRRIRDAA